MRSYVVVIIFLLILIMVINKPKKIVYHTDYHQCDHSMILSNDLLHDNFSNIKSSMDKDELIQYIREKIIFPNANMYNKKFRHIDLSKQSLYKLLDIIKNKDNINELNILLDSC